MQQPTYGQICRSAELKLARRLKTFRGHLVATTATGRMVTVFDRTDGQRYTVEVSDSDISWC